MASKPMTKDEAAELNKAIKMLHNFCNSHFACKDCPFRKEGVPLYGTPCKFGSFYPELWDDLEIKWNQNKIDKLEE